MAARGKVLLVGSIGLADVETVFKVLSDSLGSLAARYPDGECGIRSRWILWQQELFSGNSQLEVSETQEVYFGGERRLFEKFRIMPGIQTEKIELGPLGYAEEAIKSYRIFKQFYDDGIIPAGTRFQVSLPTPVAVSTQYTVATYQAIMADVYETGLKREIQSMTRAIPAERLAIQWDVCQEVLAADGAWPVYYNDLVEGAVDRLQRLSRLVPENCQLGFHLCYGDPGHKHIKEPEDLSICMQFANRLCTGNGRRVNWIHMPVPRGRRDGAYFEPLQDLNIPEDTELYLGLIHLTDGISGARQRLESAGQVITDFGTATECGFGRRPAETIPELLNLHSEITALQKSVL